MKILLLNDNPVVNKLVTLSAQKTSNEIDVALNVEGIMSQNYDLLIVDDSVYTDELLDLLQTKIKYKKSLFICARDAQKIDSFTSVLKKPFLPTDLVELFMLFEKEAQNEEVEDESKSANNELEEGLDENFEIGDDLLDEEMSLDEDMNLDNDMNLDEDLHLDSELSLDDEEDVGESVLDDEEAQKVKELLDENEDELNFEEETQADIESFELEENGANKEELESLEEFSLDEVDSSVDYDMALDLEDEADADIAEDESLGEKEEAESLENDTLEELDSLSVEDNDLDDTLEVLEDSGEEEVGEAESEPEKEVDEDLEEIGEISDLATQEMQEETQTIGELEELPTEFSQEEAVEEDEELLEEPAESLEEMVEAPTEEIVTDPAETAEEGSDKESEESFEEIVEAPVVSEDTNIEDEIQNAVENLTQEDLESELDEDTLLQIATNEIDPLADVTSRDLKLALGEEVEEEPEEVVEPESTTIAEERPEIAKDVDEEEVQEQSQEANNSGVEGLKKLLEALNDKDVAASMKGMKISINITLGDK